MIACYHAWFIIQANFFLLTIKKNAYGTIKQLRTK